MNRKKFLQVLTHQNGPLHLKLSLHFCKNEKKLFLHSKIIKPQNESKYFTIVPIFLDDSKPDNFPNAT